MSSRHGPVLGGGFKHENRSKHNRFEDTSPSYDEDVEEQDNYRGNYNDNDDLEDDDSQQQTDSDGNDQDDNSLPLFERLARLTDSRSNLSNSNETSSSQRRIKKNRDPESSKNEKFGRLNKNAPAVMKSNRPVRRLRLEANNSVKKTVDPRFTEISGKMDEKIFAKNYSFLDEYRSEEITKLSNVMRKVKSVGKKTDMKADLIRMKQEATERRRGLKVMERFESLKAEEREKIKGGKKPFFLKSAAKKVVGLEERYSELKREGKLNKFMTKKRKANSNKDHRWLPSRRGMDE